MSTIITRTGKGSALEWEEVDANFTNLNTDKVEKTAADITGGTINGTSIGATTPSTVTATTLVVNDNTTLGSSNSDTINFVGRVNSDFEPATDNTYDLGRVGHEWRNLYIDGTANIDNLVADTAAITGGTIDNTVIGNNTPAAGTFTTLTATGQTSLGGVTDSESMRVLPPASTGTYIQVQSASSTVAEFRAIGSQATNSLRYVTRGSGNHIFSTGNSGSTVQLQVAHTASAVNYVQVTGAATGGATKISTQGSDANVGMDLVLKGNPVGPGFRVLNQGGTGTCFAVLVSTASVVNHPRANPSAAGNPVSFGAEGSDTNIGLNLLPKGTGAVRNVTGGGEQLRVSNTASAVNFVQVTGAATGDAPKISAQGSDANTGMLYYSKGFGSHQFRGYNGANIFGQFFANQASPVNYIEFGASSSGNAVLVRAAGSDTNIDLALTSKGTGTVVANGPFTATGQTSLGGVADSEGLRVVTTASAVNYLQAAGAATGFQPVFSVQGADANVGPAYTAKGTGRHDFYTQGINSRQFSIANTSSAVNYVQVTGAATGSGSTTGVIVSAQGSDTTTNLALQGKGSAGGVTLGTGFGVSFKAVGFAGSTIVNNLQAQGSATTISPVLSAQGSDTNISQVFQSKGTGAINLAPGSSGVNISNGGTVTAITRTATGSNYTSIPSVVISAPTTAGGVTATATCTVGVATFAVAAGGTGYTVGNVLTVVGGTGTAATFTVATLSGSAVATVTSTNAGSYSAVPTNPASTTGGTGTGCTININTYAVTSGGFTITTAGSGYVEQPTVTFSGGGGSGAAAFATVGAGTVIRSLGTTGTQTIDFAGPNYISASSPMLRLRDIGTSDTFVQIVPNVSYTQVLAQGNSNATLALAANGSGRVSIQTNGTSQTEQLRVTHTASAVNYVQVTGAATGGIPAITVQGSDSNIRMNISSKGTESLDILTNNTGTRAAKFTHTASAVNWVQMTGAAAGSAPSYAVAGNDTNIDLVLTPKGTGNVRFGTFTADMTLVVQGYIEVKDSGGTIRKLAVIA